MITLKQIYYTLFLLGWFFFPFNEFDGIPALGEFKSEAGAFFFIAGFVIMGVDVLFKKRVSLPYRSLVYKLLLLFIVWCFITTLLNIGMVAESYYKHTGGIYRFVRQYISLVISVFIIPLFFWNVIKDMAPAKILQVIRKVLLVSLLFAFVYGFLETLIVIFNMYFLLPVLQLFDYFPFLKGEVTINRELGRISSVAYEAPSLGNYLITVAPWMFSYILTQKKIYRFIPTVLILFLTFFSGSRTALINVTLELILFFGVLFYIKEHRAMVINIIKATAVTAMIVIAFNGPRIIEAFNEKAETLNFSKNLTKSISNKSRFGMQYASLQVFKENPVIGVGFGQETYFKRFHYPSWATNNNWEFPFYYKNQKDPSFPSAYNMYTRLLAETGIVGALLFISIVFLCIRGSVRLWKAAAGDSKSLALILILSFTGLSFNWMQTDFFRQYGFWLCMVILISLQQRNFEAHE